MSDDRILTATASFQNDTGLRANIEFACIPKQNFSVTATTFDSLEEPVRFFSKDNRVVYLLARSNTDNKQRLYLTGLNRYSNQVSFPDIILYINQETGNNPLSIFNPLLLANVASCSDVTCLASNLIAA